MKTLPFLSESADGFSKINFHDFLGQNICIVMNNIAITIIMSLIHFTSNVSSSILIQLYFKGYIKNAIFLFCTDNLCVSCLFVCFPYLDTAFKLLIHFISLYKQIF